MVAEENFGESGAIHQSITHLNLYHKTMGRLKIHAANELWANSWN